MARFDLTDFEWSVIEPLLPNKVRGVARVDDRRVLNGIFWRHEYTDMYPGMARTARQEGFEEIADWFETLAKAEKSHAGRFQKALDTLS